MDWPDVQARISVVGGYHHLDPTINMGFARGEEDATMAAGWSMHHATRSSIYSKLHAWIWKGQFSLGEILVGGAGKGQRTRGREIIRARAK